RTPTQRNTQPSIDTSSSTVTPNTAPACDDSNASMLNYTCTGSGQCVGTALTCTSDQCNTRTCNGTASCTVTPNTGAACDDGNACSFNDTCDGSGHCGGTALTCTSDHGNARPCNRTASCPVPPDT